MISLSLPRLNIFTVGNMGVIICLGQGGLRSLSASSCVFAHLLILEYPDRHQNLIIHCSTQDPSITFHPIGIHS